jgi:hypothetical protein
MIGQRRAVNGRIMQVNGKATDRLGAIKSRSDINPSATQPTAISTGLGFLTIH